MTVFPDVSLHDLRIPNRNNSAIYESMWLLKSYVKHITLTDLLSELKKKKQKLLVLVIVFFNTNRSYEGLSKNSSISMRKWPSIFPNTLTKYN